MAILMFALHIFSSLCFFPFLLHSVLHKSSFSISMVFFSLVSRSFCSLYENNFPYILPHHNFHFLYNCSLAIFLRKPFLPTKAFLNLVDSSLMIPPHPVLMLDLPPCIVTSSLLGSNLLNPKL